MAILRNTIRANVKKALQESYFGIAAFNPVFSEDLEDTKSLFTITFRPEPDYYFRATKGNKPDWFDIEFVPAGFELRGGHPVNQFSNVINCIRDWTKRVHEEVIAAENPKDAVKNLLVEIENAVSKMQDRDERFSPTEAKAMREKLEAIEDILSKAATQEIFTNQEIEKLKKDIEDLKNDVLYFKKGIWFRTAASKLSLPGIALLAPQEAINEKHTSDGTEDLDKIKAAWAALLLSGESESAQSLKALPAASPKQP